jgi:Ferritin-like
LEELRSEQSRENQELEPENVMTQAWTAALVQGHAQACVTVELYTLPFYFTALTSITDTTSPAYGNVLSACMEEMLHLEMAANLCLALDTPPPFAAPIYGTPIPYLDPDDPETNQYALVNAILGPLNQTTLDTMLNIETPEEVETGTDSGPTYPYDSIGEMYDALLDGINSVGWANLYVGNTTNQQAIFGATNFSETIDSLAAATTAIATINAQGEGQVVQPAPVLPYTMADFPVPAANQLTVEPLDPTTWSPFAHFGRFVNIASAPLPATYTGVDPTGPLNPAQQAALTLLQGDFTTMLGALTTLWTTGGGSLWPVMPKLSADATGCWQAGVIPMWSAAQAAVTPRPRAARSGMTALRRRRRPRYVHRPASW